MAVLGVSYRPGVGEPTRVARSRSCTCRRQLGLSEPVHEGGIRRFGREDALERGDERADGWTSLSEAPWVEDDYAVMVAFLVPVLTLEGEKVLAVVGHDRPFLLLGALEQV